MVTGASTADLALVLIDARKGLLEQSRRHAYLAALLGIRHLVACVNKMDLVGFDEARFREIEAAFGALGAQLGIADVRAVPISALEGDNVVDALAAAGVVRRRRRCSSSSRRVEVDRDRNLDDVRFPVQWTVRGDDYRGYAGRVAGGVLATGDEVVVLPVGLALAGRARSTRRAGRSRRAFAADGGDAAARGRARRRPRRPRRHARRRAGGRARARGHRLLDGRGARPRRRALPAQAHRRGACGRTSRRSRRAWTSTPSRRQPADELGLNDIGRITLRTAAPVLADPYAANRATGAFILIDERTHDTVAAGMVEAARAGRAAEIEHSPDIRWHPSALERSRALGVDRPARGDASG